MLQQNITNFLDECKHYSFSKSTIAAFTTRLNELDHFLESQQVQSLDQITYRHLMEFVSSRTSNDIKKVRVWALRRFFRFLKVHRLLEVDIARELPYPKLEQTEPQFLTLEELTAILTFFSSHARTSQGLRNLLIVMIFGFPGLRLSTLLNLNIQDVVLAESLLWVRDKGYVRRPVPMPQIVCIYLYQYLKSLDIKMGPLFLSKRKKRISPRSVQYIFDIAESELDLNKHLHCHLFRHTAATQINQTAGVDITRSLLGHRSRRTTEQYIHLDGIVYADHMGHHPYYDSKKGAGHE